MKEARMIVTTALANTTSTANDTDPSSLDSQIEKERQELEALSLQQRGDQKIAVVIDANVLIKQIRLQEVMGASDSQEFDAAYEVHTIKEVIKEIKDDNARTFMQNLPYELVIHDYVEDEFLDRVRAFAKETGDYKTLSETDMRVMALGLQLNEERGDGDRVQKAPKPLAEFRPKRFQEDYKRIEDGEEDQSDEETDSAEGSEQEEQAQGNRRGKNPKEGEGFDDDGFQQVTQKKHGDRKNHIQPKTMLNVIKEEKVFVEEEQINTSSQAAGL